MVDSIEKTVFVDMDEVLCIKNLPVIPTIQYLKNEIDNGGKIVLVCKAESYSEKLNKSIWIQLNLKEYSKLVDLYYLDEDRTTKGFIEMFCNSYNLDKSSILIIDSISKMYELLYTEEILAI